MAEEILENGSTALFLLLRQALWRGMPPITLCGGPCGPCEEKS